MKVANATAEAMLSTVIDANVLVSLHTADPGLTGASEITGGHRVTIEPTEWSAYATANGNRAVTNANEEEFTATASADETVTHFTLWEADGTTVILSAPISNPQVLVTGNPVRFPAGAFTFGMRVDTTV